MTAYITSPEPSPQSSGASYTPSAAELTAWPLFQPHVASKGALWIDATARAVQNGGADGPPHLFRLLDRAGQRIFTTEKVRNRHPYRVTDTLTDRPVFMFGAGGQTPNDLSAPANGAIRTVPVETPGAPIGNNAPIWTPDVGWSVAFKARLPTVGGTINSVAYTSPFTGGAVIGGAGEDTAGVNASPSVGFDNGTGYLQGFNQFGVQTVGAYFSNNVDRRDGTWHDYVVTYDDATGTFRAWVDGALVTTQASITTDVGATADARRPEIGGVGVPSTGPANRFMGALAFVGFLPGPALNDADKRALIRAVMAEK